MQLDEWFTVALLDDASDDLGVNAAMAGIDVRSNGTSELWLQCCPSFLNEAFDTTSPKVYFVDLLGWFHLPYEELHQVLP